jgi:D-alanyl-D-alanine carboxypeptidase
VGGSRFFVRLVALIALLALFLTVAAPLTAAPLAPTITAGNAIVLDPDTKLALFERDSHERVAPASLTKVMTALVAIEEGDLAQQVTIAREDLIGEASMGLQVGERVSLETLLYGLLLPSGNDAAMAIARAVGTRPGDRSGAVSVARFTGWMNDAATRLELVDSRFVNPHGLDADGHYSSAFDLARLTGFAWQNPAFARIFGSASYQGEGHVLQHGNRLIGQYDGVVGGKTGLTDGCGFCLITAAQHAGHRLVVVVLRDTRAGAFTDTTALLGWSYGQVAAGNAPAVAPPPSPVAAAPSPAPVATAANPGVGVPAVSGAVVPTVLAGQPASLTLPAPAVVSGSGLSVPPSSLAAACVGLLVLALLWVSRSRNPGVLR